MATIFVGKTKQPFYVHLDLLCHDSYFFDAVFAGNSKEAFEKTIQLPDDRESTFKLFVAWLYGDRQTILPVEEDDDKHEKLFPVVCLFMLADKYKVYGLKIKMIEILWGVLDECKDYSLSYSTVAYAYDNTTQGSDIRKILAFFLTIWAYEGKCEGTDLPALLKQQPDLAFDMIGVFATKFMPNPFEKSGPKECKNKSKGQGSEQSNAK